MFPSSPSASLSEISATRSSFEEQFSGKANNPRNEHSQSPHSTSSYTNMDSPSSVYSDELPPTPTLPSPASPFVSNNIATVRRRSFGPVAWGNAPTAWAAEKEVLKSMITGTEFVLGSPRNSLVCQRRIFDRKTNRGSLCDPDGWQGSMFNQLLLREQIDKNRRWREQRAIPLQGPEMFRTIHWDKPASAASRDEPVSPRTVQSDSPPVGKVAFSSVTWNGPKKPVEHSSANNFSNDELTETDMSKYEEAGDISPQSPSSTYSSLDLLVPKIDITDAKKTVEEVIGIDNDEDAQDKTSSGESSHLRITLTPSPESTTSLARFIQSEAPGFPDLTTTTTNDSEDFPQEDAVIGTATLAMPIAMPIPIPPRGRSLLNLRVLEAGVASRARRPPIDDSASDSSSLITHHTNLIPTTFEIGTARAVRLSRPPPVKLIIIGGRAIAMNQPESLEASVPSETASSLQPSEETRCASPVHLWSKLSKQCFSLTCFTLAR